MYVYYKMFCLRLGMNHHSYQQIYNIHTWCIYNSNQRDIFFTEMGKDGQTSEKDKWNLSHFN